MIARHPAGHLWTITCDTCGSTAQACGDFLFDAADTATRAGWSIGIVDRCRDCPTPEPALVAAGKRRR